MVEVYLYMPAEQIENAVECGIKLSEWYSREVNLEGERRKCISALLNPRDDHEKYMSAAYRCLKLEIQSKYCYIADSLLYQPGLGNPALMDMYHCSIMPVEQYIFGTYRLPECLVCCTVIGEHIEVLGNRLDTPVLYSNSQELYFSNLFEGFREEHDDFNDTLLFYFFKSLCAAGKMTCIEDTASGLAIFKDERNARAYTVRIPDIGNY